MRGSSNSRGPKQGTHSSACVNRSDGEGLGPAMQDCADEPSWRASAGGGRQAERKFAPPTARVGATHRPRGRRRWGGGVGPNYQKNAGRPAPARGTGSGGADVTSTHWLSASSSAGRTCSLACRHCCKSARA